MQLQWPADCILNRINSKREDSHAEVMMTGSKKSEKFVIIFKNEDERKKWVSACKQIKSDRYKSIRVSKNLPIETFLESSRTMLTQNRGQKIQSGRSTISKTKGRLSILMDTDDVTSADPKQLSKLKRSSSQLSISDQLESVNELLKKPENKVSIHDLAGKNHNYTDFISKIDLGNGWEEVKLNNGLVYYENSENLQRSFEHPFGANVIKRMTSTLKERPSVQSMFYDPSHLSFSMDAGLSVIDENESDIASMIGSIRSISSRKPTYHSEASVFEAGHEWHTQRRGF